MVKFVNRVGAVPGLLRCINKTLKDELTGEIFMPLNDPQVFAALKFEPDLDTVVWDNGADFAPEFLYELAKRQKENRSA